MSDEEIRNTASTHLLNKGYRTIKNEKAKNNLDKSIN
jgi:hypothetical protein